MTRDINDGYMGSGTDISHALDTLGVENFEKEILYLCESAQEMNQKEKELVTVDFIKRDDNYNMVPGGSRRTCNCPDCGVEVTINNFTKHLKSKQCVINQKDKKNDRKKGECVHCKMDYSHMTSSDKANHTRWCDKNPKRNDYNFDRAGDKNPMFGKTAWNKGSTKDTDVRVKHRGEKLKERYSSGELVSHQKGKPRTEEEKKKFTGRPPNKSKQATNITDILF